MGGTAGGRPYSKGEKNDFRDVEAIAEAVQRPTMKFVATKTVDQLDLEALHRVHERLVGRRTGIINQIRAFLLERGVAVRHGFRFFRTELPRILAAPADVVSPGMVRIVDDLAGDWQRLDDRTEAGTTHRPLQLRRGRARSAAPSPRGSAAASGCGTKTAPGPGQHSLGGAPLG